MNVGKSLNLFSFFICKMRCLDKKLYIFHKYENHGFRLLRYSGFAEVCIMQAHGAVFFPEVSSGVIH